jgi:hypothetical protein
MAKKATKKTPPTSGASKGIVKDKNFVHDQLMEQIKIMAAALGIETEKKLRKDLVAQILKKLTRTSLRKMCMDTETWGKYFSRHLLQNVRPKHARHHEDDENKKTPNEKRIDVILKHYF